MAQQHGPPPRSELPRDSRWEGETKLMTHRSQAPVRRVVARLAPLAVLLSLGMACDLIPGFGSPGPEVSVEADAALRKGDLPGASAQYASLAEDHAESTHVAIGQAYMQVLRGDHAGADATLAAVEESAGDMIGQLKLRRALVAVEAGDVDGVKRHGLASGLPEGKLLAAEGHMADIESEEAGPILREIAETPGVVGQTAKSYLALLDSGDQIKVGVAETTALWALGDRQGACENIEELVTLLPEEDSQKSALLLLWAGRAATSGQTSVASNLLDELSFPPEGQAWRVQATRAIISAADGEMDEAVRIFDALDEGGAPADGLADARATACALVTDRTAAKRLVGDLESPAIARC